MATTAPFPESLETHRLVAEQEPDRLPAMLFLAALIHGILIIGITFNPTLGLPPSDAISLEVTIVANPDQQIDRPDRAAYLAQASQSGGGNTTESVRPSAPLSSSMPVDNPGSEDGTGLVDAVAHERMADEVIATRNDSDRSVAIDPRSEPQAEDTRAIAMQAGSDLTLPLPQEEQATLLIRDKQPRQLIISADTRESVVATYLDNWKRRIEAVGASYLPELGDLGTISGSPVLIVSIASGGDLVDAEIRKSSGSAVLDLAALDILQRASPFNPFPQEVAADYDTLRFEYKWLFAEQLVPAAPRGN
jgi:protein TonB